MKIFNEAVDILKILVVALMADLSVSGSSTCWRTIAMISPLLREKAELNEKSIPLAGDGHVQLSE